MVDVTLQPYYKSSVLAVEDQAVNLKILCAFLRKFGFLKIETAKNGLEALEKLNKFTPDIIITDLVMPEMDGFTLINEIKKQTHLKDIPIIIQTSLASREEHIQAWNSGATDIIAKPLHESELASRLEIHINNKNLINILQQQKEDMNSEIQQGLLVQKSLLPQQNDEIKDYCDGLISIQSIFHPSKYLSGDLWGVIKIDTGKLGVWVADYSSKGIKAALNVFRLHTLIQDHHTEADSPSLFIENINHKLCNLLPTGQFITFFYVIIDTVNSEITCVPAGSPNPIRLMGDEKFDFLDSAGMPLGVTKEANYESYTKKIKAGEHILLYSDELWEDDQIETLYLTVENISKLLKNSKKQGFFTYYKAQLEKSLAGKTLGDDLTLIDICIK